MSEHKQMLNGNSKQGEVGGGKWEVGGGRWMVGGGGGMGEKRPV